MISTRNTELSPSPSHHDVSPLSGQDHSYIHTYVVRKLALRYVCWRMGCHVPANTQTGQASSSSGEGSFPLKSFTINWSNVSGSRRNCRIASSTISWVVSPTATAFLLIC